VASLVAARLRAFFFPERGTPAPSPFAVVALAGIIAATAVALSAPGSRAEWMLYDVFVRRLTTGATPAPGIVVVAIDEPSFAEVGQPWPWPRALHGALIDRLVQAGARTIAFDILFDVAAADHEDDEVLAAAIGRAGRVILAADQAVIDDRGYSLTQWTEPIPALAERAAALGVDRIPYDQDFVLRHTTFAVEGRPTLAAAIAARDPGFQPLQNPDAARLIRFNGPPRHGIVTVSYYQALDPSALAADTFRDKHVLIGRSLAAATIDAQADHFMTPVSPQTPGVEIHATILDGLLRHRFIDEPLADRNPLVAWSIAAAALIALLLYWVGPAAGLMAALAIVSVWIAASYGMLARGVHLPIVVPVAAVVGGYASTAAYRYALLRRERRLIKRAFQHYVAPAIVEQMLADPTRLKLGGTEYVVSVLFSDLEGFTTLGEHLTPAELGAHLGQYFKAMLDVLLPERGTLDKLIGDAIMMYFGCPIPDERHARQACRGALAMQRQMVALNARWAADGLPQLRTRVGINTGRAVAGNMGTDTIFNYTILGDAVNLAARLEGINKEYGTLIIVGEDTWRLVHTEFEGRELDWIRVKGKTQPVAIFELVAEAGSLDAGRRDLFTHYTAALAHYRAGRWQDAIEGFDRVLTLDAHDGPSLTLRERCREYLANAPATWDGVHVMKTK
jgi:adenylate cyclase